MSSRMLSGNQIGWRTEINRDSLSATKEFWMSRRDLAGAGVGETIRIKAPDGYERDFVIVESNGVQLLLRPTPQNPK